MVETVRILGGRRDMAKAHRRNQESEIQDIYDLMYPMRDETTRKRSPGQRRIRGVFDTTAMMAAQGFTNWLKGTAIPSHTDWLRLSPPEDLLTSVRARQLSDSVAKKVTTAFSASNFYREMGVFLRDLSILGTSYLQQEEKKPVLRNNGSTFGGFQFTAIPWSEMWLVAGAGNRVMMNIHETKMPAIDAARLFDNPGKQTRAALEKNNEMEIVNYVRFLYENDGALTEGLRRPDQMPWVSDFMADNHEGDLERIRVRGHEFNPLITARWEMINNDVYGTGIGHITRVDAMAINDVRRRVLIAAGVDLQPPIMAEEGTIIDLNLDPNGIMVTRPSVKMNPQFFKTEASYDVADGIMITDRGQIDRAFQTNNINPPKTQPRTAEESSRLRELAAQSLSAPADVIQTEGIQPIVILAIDIMWKAGALPEIDELAQLGASSLDLVLVSPFFQAQRSAPAQRLRFWLDEWTVRAGNLGDPTILRPINMERALAISAESNDIPAGALNTDEEMEAILAQEQAAAQQQQQQQAIQTAADVAGKLGGADALQGASAEQLQQLVQ